MRTVYALLAAVLLNLSLQGQARYVFIDFKDSQKPGLQTEFSFSDKTVADAIDAKLSKLGYKGRDTKGYTMYKGVQLSELGNQPYDLYFKVERKSRKDRDAAVVNMLISNGNEVFVSDATDSATIGRGKRYLNSLLPDVEAWDLQQQLNDQLAEVGKSEKKYKSLQDDLDDLQKKKKKLEDQIQDNLKAQKDQQAEIEKQKQLYESLKAKQKN